MSSMISLIIAASIRLWPLGDSITEGSNNTANYRIPLCRKLEAAGHHVETVGFRTLKHTDSRPGTIPERWWAHTGISGQRVRSAAGLAGYLRSLSPLLDQAGKADFIVLKIGTNDIIFGDKGEDVFANWLVLVKRLLAECPESRIVVATILHMPGELDEQVKALNERIRAQVAEKGKDAFPAGRVFLADLEPTVVRERGDYLDRFHPNWQGHEHTSDVLFKVINSILTTDPQFKSPANKNAQTEVKAPRNTARIAASRNGFVRVAQVELPTESAPVVTRLKNLPKKFSKVGYFFELGRKNQPTRWVWCDMDAWSSAFGDLLPGAQKSFRGEVKNLHFASNDPALSAIAIAPDENGRTGWVEATESAYNPGGSFGFGRGDVFDDSKRYGCFQIFSEDNLLFAFNRFAIAGANEIGIGNFDQHYLGNQRRSGDYTGTSETETMSAPAFTVRNLEVWVK